VRETSVTDLPLGTTYNGTLVGSAQAQLFRVTVPDARPLLVTLRDASPAHHTELYVKFGSAPSRSDYQFRSSSAATANQQVLVPMAAPGTLYILLYGASVPAAGAYTLTAAEANVFVTGVTPDHHGDSADATLTLSGGGFDRTTTVSLV